MRVASYSRFLFFALVLVALSAALSAASYAQVGIGISVNFAPPALPVYEQPPCPAENYIWTPGYWAWDADDGDYYWVPGTWVLAPEVGFLWTPPWWGWSDGVYLFHEGFWGPHVGFYGGIVYGFGYFGHGYEGGRWDGGRFFYNRSVNNINVTNIHNVYNTTVINNTTVNRVSYNGPGGVQERPRPEEQQAERERHLPPAPVQRQHEQVARTNPQQRASVNQGRPPVAATARPTDFKAAVPAKEAGAPYHPPAERGRTPAARNEPAGRPESAPRPGNEARPENPGRPENNVPKPPNATHAKDLQPHQPATPPSTGNAARDQKYQQQQAKLAQKQNQEHQKLQQQQEQEHQRVAQNANPARTQQLEQKHQQQTQQLEQKHTQQQQRLQQKQQPPKAKGR